MLWSICGKLNKLVFAVQDIGYRISWMLGGVFYKSFFQKLEGMHEEALSFINHTCSADAREKFYAIYNADPKTRYLNYTMLSAVALLLHTYHGVRSETERQDMLQQIESIISDRDLLNGVCHHLVHIKPLPLALRGLVSVAKHPKGFLQALWAYTHDSK